MSNEETVIQGTLNLVDLIPAFMGELALRDPIEASRIADKYRGALQDLGCDLDNGEFITYVDIDTVGMEGVTELIEALDYIAPEGYYFGSHPNDITAFGFYLNG